MFVRTLYVDKAFAKLLLHNTWLPMPLNPEKVAKYAEEMRAGRWSSLIADGSIIVRSGDTLKNGAHRLNAVIASDTHQVFRVAVLLPGWDCAPDGKIFKIVADEKGEAA